MDTDSMGRADRRCRDRTLDNPLVLGPLWPLARKIRGGSMRLEPQRGDFVRVRSRRWLVEDEPAIDGLRALRLACVDDDALGETAEVLWDAEIDGEVLGEKGWASVARSRPKPVAG